ncbi:MAG: energy transducer TonB [Bryobacteraceae bacterium]
MTSDVEKETVEPPPAPSYDSHLDRLLMSEDLDEPWYKSIGRGIRETLNPPKLPPLELTSKPLESSDLGDMSKIEQPWFKSLISNVKDLVHPPKLPPLEVTSKPVEVGTIWGAYSGGESKSGAISLLIHISVVVLMLFIFQSPTVQKKLKNITDIYFPIQPYKPKLPPASEQAGGGGGGGQHTPTPVSRGEAPKFARKQFMPPAMAVPQPKLPLVPTITAQAPVIVADNYGDPLAKSMPFSGGPGSNGLGSGTGNGVGSGNGNGYGPGSGGGMGGGVYRIGGDVSQPIPIYKPDPEYSEEARKAKYSGTVLVSVVIDEHGLPRDIHVIRPLGLGLDEKAVEAVRTWRFIPGKKAGKPVAVEANIEISFRLL